MSGLFSRKRSRSSLRRSRKQAMAGVMDAVLRLAAPAASLMSKPKRGGAKPRPKTPAAKPKPRQAVAAPDKTGRSPESRPIARGASFRTASFSCAHGQRRYKLFLPASACGEVAPVPLLLMLHGCGQTPDDFAKGTRMNALAEEFGVIVLYPAQPRDAHPNRCWNWFRRGDQGRDAGEPALLAELTRQVMAQHHVDPARVYVAGLSAGASAALILADAYPDMFAAVGAHSGLPVGAARDNASAVAAMQRGNPGRRRSAAVPTITFHGSADHVVNPRNGRLIALRALEPYPSLRRTDITGKIADGRSFVKTVHRIGQGRPLVEHWRVEGSGHAWSGGSSAGRFTDPSGPDASREMLRFFLRHRLTARGRRAIAAP